MSKKVFVSYCHRQGEWVLNRLVSCLRAGGAEVYIDHERFKAGLGVIGQMDAMQDAAEITVLVLSPDYLKSDYCRHEMARALGPDPHIDGSTIPIKQQECEMPEEIKAADLLWVDLCDDKDIAQWELLLQACEADLGANAPHWLDVRDEILRSLQYNESINLVVIGQPQAIEPKWKELIEHLNDHLSTPKLEQVDLYKGQAVTRPGLVEAILYACGIKTAIPDVPEDLSVLDKAISARNLSLLALLHLDIVPNRPVYDIDLFSSLRYLAESRKLVLIAQSRKPLSMLLPQNHPLSSFIPKVIELRGRNK